MVENLYFVAIGVGAVEAARAVAMRLGRGEDLHAVCAEVGGPRVHIFGLGHHDAEVVETLAGTRAERLLVIEHDLPFALISTCTARRRSPATPQATTAG